MTRKPLHEGQEVYFVSNLYGRTSTPTVVKAGRRWATLSNGHRADKETWLVDGGEYASPGTLWPDAKAHEAWVKVVSEYQKFRINVSGYPKDGVTLDDISAARKLLRLDTDTESSK